MDIDMMSACIHSRENHARHPECTSCRDFLRLFWSSAYDGTDRWTILPVPGLLESCPSIDMEAERDEPRPGLWAGEKGADLRRLTQDETDMLIRCELHQAGGSTRGFEMLPEDRQRELVGILGEPRYSVVVGKSSVSQMLNEGEPVKGHYVTVRDGHGAVDACCQRGGIDSDPLVRILARRAWGERDREWFELRGVRKGDPITPIYPYRNVYARAWHGETPFGYANNDARPGEMVNVNKWESVRVDRFHRAFTVGDRLRHETFQPGVATDDLLTRREVLLTERSVYWVYDDVQPPSAYSASAYSGIDLTFDTEWPSTMRATSPMNPISLIDAGLSLMGPSGSAAADRHAAAVRDEIAKRYSPPPAPRMQPSNGWDLDRSALLDGVIRVIDAPNPPPRPRTPKPAAPYVPKWAKKPRQRSQKLKTRR